METLKNINQQRLYFGFLLSVPGACSSSAESLNYLLADRKTSSVELGSLEGEDVKSGGKAAVLIVGGAAESLKCKPGCYNIILRRRKGFVRIALKNGLVVLHETQQNDRNSFFFGFVKCFPFFSSSPLVPVISFGETDLYNQITAPEGSMLNKAQQLFRKITGIAPVFPIGRGFFQYSFGVVPKRKPVTVVGEQLIPPSIQMISYFNYWTK